MSEIIIPLTELAEAREFITDRMVNSFYSIAIAGK